MGKTFSRLVKGLISAGLTLSVLTVPAYADAVNSSSDVASADYVQDGMKLVKYNCDTGEFTNYTFTPTATYSMNEDEGVSPEYSPNGETDAITPYAVIGKDNRIRIEDTKTEPYNNTCYMVATYSDGSKSGVFSGFMLGPNSAVTAAHCMYSHKNGKYAKSVTVIPAKNGSLEPYGSSTSSNIIYKDEYVAKESREDDWAIIELKSSDIGNRTGWLGLKWQTASFNDTDVENTGYPARSDKFTKQNSSNSYMFLGAGKIRTTNSNGASGRGTLYGDWDASGGNSGGPVFANYTDSGHTAIGILTAGTDDGDTYSSSSCFTLATRISKEMFDLFVTYR